MHAQSVVDELGDAEIHSEAGEHVIRSQVSSSLWFRSGRGRRNLRHFCPPAQTRRVRNRQALIRSNQ